MLLERAVPITGLQIGPPFAAVVVPVSGLSLVPLEVVEGVAVVVADPVEGLPPELDFGQEVDLALGEVLRWGSRHPTGVVDLVQCDDQLWFEH